MHGSCWADACAAWWRCHCTPRHRREPPQAAAPEQPGDAWITTRIRAALVPLQRDGHADVRVATAAGMVTLEGSVDSPITRDRVVELATRVWGVRGVEAQALQVAGTAPYP